MQDKAAVQFYAAVSLLLFPPRRGESFIYPRRMAERYTYVGTWLQWCMHKFCGPLFKPHSLSFSTNNKKKIGSVSLQRLRASAALCWGALVPCDVLPCGSRCLGFRCSGVLQPPISWCELWMVFTGIIRRDLQSLGFCFNSVCINMCMHWCMKAVAQLCGSKGEILMCWSSGI